MSTLSTLSTRFPPPLAAKPSPPQSGDTHHFQSPLWTSPAACCLPPAAKVADLTPRPLYAVRMGTIAFRRAVAPDLPSIIALLAGDPLGRTREDPATPPAAAYVSAFEAIDRDPNQLLAVVTDDDRVVGVLQLTFIPGLSRKGMWRGQIEGVRIAASRRGAGLGGRVFEWAIAECRAR